jgi:ribosomal protein S18 acetylase RimI-like enzyme
MEVKQKQAINMVILKEELENGLIFQVETNRKNEVFTTYSLFNDEGEMLTTMHGTKTKKYLPNWTRDVFGNDKLAYLHSFHTLNEHRNNGYGRKLLQMVVNHHQANGGETLFLGVSPVTGTNTDKGRLMHLYMSAGFKEIKQPITTRRGYLFLSVPYMYIKTKTTE